MLNQNKLEEMPEESPELTALVHLELCLESVQEELPVNTVCRLPILPPTTACLWRAEVGFVVSAAVLVHELVVRIVDANDGHVRVLLCRASPEGRRHG